jgi:hypothetical protein
MTAKSFDTELMFIQSFPLDSKKLILHMHPVQ